ncbi:MAG: SIMPL domain-containing protein [Gemmatimonadaceae bacterium]|nr:SIMPL domain-containing protein [Gemmatimonadaceae bacterium]
MFRNFPGLVHLGVRALPRLLVSGAIGILVPLAGFAQQGAGASTVNASGAASISVEPDLALITIQYSAAGRTPAIAGRAAAERANAIRAAIIALGVPPDSLPTTGAGGWRWTNRSGIQVRNDMRDTSYVTNDAFTVRLRNLALVGRVIDTALVRGAQTISNVEFQATNTREVELEAIRRATLDARARAAAVAAASGLALGRVVEVNVITMPGAIAMPAAMSEGLSLARAADAGTTIVAPELKVQVNVNGKWEMVARRR